MAEIMQQLLEVARDGGDVVAYLVVYVIYQQAKIRQELHALREDYNAHKVETQIRLGTLERVTGVAKIHPEERPS